MSDSGYTIGVAIPAPETAPRPHVTQGYSLEALLHRLEALERRVAHLERVTGQDAPGFNPTLDPPEAV